MSRQKMNLSEITIKLKDVIKEEDIIYSILDKHLNLMNRATICENSVFKREVKRS